MKTNLFLRLGACALLFLALSAEKCVEVTELSAPNTVTPNTAFTAKTRLKHLGNDVNNFNIDYYLSYDRIVNPEDRFIGYGSVTNCPAGEAREVTSMLTVPSVVAAGKYYLIIKAQDGEMYREMTVQGPPISGIDLAPMNLFLFGQKTPGGNLSYAFTLENRGAAAANAAFKVTVYLSQNTLPDAGDWLLATVPVSSALAGGQYREFSLSSVIPPDVPPGTYYLIISADPNNQVSENYENNNTVSQAFDVAESVVAPATEERSASAAPALELALGPNPVSSALNLSLTLPEATEVSLAVFNSEGQLVHQRAAHQLDAGTLQHTIDLSALLPGMYLVQVKAGDRVITRKVIKQ